MGELLNGSADPIRFEPLVTRMAYHDLRLSGQLRPQRLSQSLRVVANQAIGDLKDLRAGAVIALETDDSRSGEAAFESGDVLDVTSSPAVDRLVVVADHPEVRMPEQEEFEESVLRRIDVLILVDHQESKLRSNPVPQISIRIEGRYRAHHHVTEIDEPVFAKVVLVRLIGVRDRQCLVAPSDRGLTRGQLRSFGRLQAILEARDRVGEVVYIARFGRGNPELAQDPEDLTFSDERPSPRSGDVAVASHPLTEGVERADGEGFRVDAELTADPFRQRVGCLLAERHRQDR